MLEWHPPKYGAMLELADKLVSKTSGVYTVRVRVPLAPHIIGGSKTGGSNTVRFPQYHVGYWGPEPSVVRGDSLLAHHKNIIECINV